MFYTAAVMESVNLPPGFRSVISVAGFKGGVAKTTTALHLAAILQEYAPTVLVDGDPNRSVTKWAKRAANCEKPLPFTIIDERQIAKEAPKFVFTVIDTNARPEREEVASLAEGSDLLILPCTPDQLSLESLEMVVNLLLDIGQSAYRVLLANVPPPPQKDGEEARRLLSGLGLPLFKAQIRNAKAFKRAAEVGSTVREIRDARAYLAWNDYEAMAEEVLKILIHQSDPAPALPVAAGA